MRTLKEKLEYNQRRDNDFSRGYCTGVRWYSEYPKLSERNKKIQLDVIDGTKQTAKMGDGFSKGVMCGIRDAANARKAKKN